MGFQISFMPINVPAPPSFDNSWDTVSAGASFYTFTNGDLTVEKDPGDWNAIRTLGSVNSGKYYTEYSIEVGSNHILGIVTVDHVFGGETWPGKDLEGYGYYIGNGKKIRNNAQVAYGDTGTASDVFGMALDLDNGAIWFSKNGTWQTNNGAAPGIVSADIAAYNATAIAGAAYTGITGTYFVGDSMFDTGNKFTSNFGATAFNTTPPTGFIGWPEP